MDMMSNDKSFVYIKEFLSSQLSLCALEWLFVNDYLHVNNIMLCMRHTRRIREVLELWKVYHNSFERDPAFIVKYIIIRTDIHYVQDITLTI